MPSESVDFLLLGGGLASTSAAETLREEGAEGSILIVSADESLPYHRPPLSKQYLQRTEPPERILIQPAGFYQEKQIALRLGTRASGLDPASHLLRIDGGPPIGYRKLLVATGGIANCLTVPGATLPGIYCLRSRADADAIRTSAQKAKRVVVIGGSFIGTELAATLTQMGLHVILVERGPHLMRKLEAPDVSAYFERKATEAGAELIRNDTVASFVGKTRVSAVVTASGRRIQCDMVVMGIGITPAAEFLAGSGIALDNGVLADDRLRTNDPDVFAAGDVANFFDPVFGKRRRIEHWDNAVKQGRLAARNMLGQHLPWEEVNYFFADAFEQSFSMLGAPEEGPDRIARGALEKADYGLFYLRNDVPRALFSLGRPPEETRAAEALIRHRVNVGAMRANLAVPDFRIDRLPSQTVLILQGGGALGAFECGVVDALEEAGIYPDIVAGVSIGAFNGAIIASHPKNAAKALDAFWNDLAVMTPDLFSTDLTRAAASWQILTMGVPRFFTPRWLGGFGAFNGMGQDWISLYDTAPVRDLIRRYVDFPRLKESPVRLLVSAVEVETAEPAIFDSYVDDITPEHIIASGSLPPGFPWTTVGGRHYWDGGILSNSPLELLVDRCGPSGKRVFVVDLFSKVKPLPRNLGEVMARRDEILYAERIRMDRQTHELLADYRKLVDEIMSWLDDESARRMKQRPRYIQLVGSAPPMSVTRIVREGEQGEPSSRDYDFSRAAIDRNRAEGRLRAEEALAAATNP